VETRALTKDDFDRIVRVIDAWWGGPSTALAHPMFHYELGQLSRVVVDEGELVGFLFGFVATAHLAPVPESPPVGARLGYVHLVGIHPDYRRRGVGKLLYAAFEQDCRAEGCTALKAITTMGDEGSVRFHLALGWNVREVADYAGPGRARLLFHKRLASS